MQILTPMNIQNLEKKKKKKMKERKKERKKKMGENTQTIVSKFHKPLESRLKVKISFWSVYFGFHSILVPVFFIVQILFM